MERLYSLAELLEEVPVGRSTMYRYLASRGYTKNCGRTFFSRMQIEEIKEDFTCHLNSLDEKVARIGTRVGRSVASAIHAQQVRQTREMQKRLRQNMKQRFGVTAGAVA